MMGENTFLLESPELQLRGEGVGSKEKCGNFLFVLKCHWKLSRAAHSPAALFAICSNTWAGERKKLSILQLGWR